MSTMNGLARLDPENGTIRVFGKADNVQGNRFNENSFFKNSRGELMFGGVAGLNYFDPSGITGTDIIPEMLITGVTVNDEVTRFDTSPDQTESITLGWSENSVGFEFTAINFRSADLTQYDYMLQGFDADWIKAGTRRFTNYTNLSPGTYRFLVRAQNADGLRSLHDAAIGITIRPPYWRTWWAYGFYVILLMVGIVVVDRVQRRRVQQKERDKAREKELEQAKEIEKAYRNLEVAHQNLKAAQDQLIQQEKLASLGQLTAGIAHEIKNPLNFVNNFSEVSVELIEEAREEVRRVTEDRGSESEKSPFEGGAGAKAEVGDDAISAKDEAPSLILEILDDIEANLRKIHEHGSRADGIVKSMLQHSRGGDGKMEPTPLNPIIKEYVNLAFHGMRAGKDPINVDIQMDLDDSIGKIPMIAEDFSRVILNICNNGFDAMREKMTGVGGPETGYVPKLTVRTKSDNGKVMIEIEDNGPGIPDEIKDKILQPFFTTKKGTQGTGLGLSISNDIIKAHRGELEIESKPGVLTCFILKLPSA